MQLNTDLDGLIMQIKESPISKLALLVIILLIIYCLINAYLNNQSNRNNFANIMVLKGVNKDIPKIDEAIIRAHIELPNRDPKMLTTSMVVPAPTVLEEAKKQTRMEILNMFYNTFDNDIVNITHRPQGLYMIP